MESTAPFLMRHFFHASPPRPPPHILLGQRCALIVTPPPHTHTLSQAAVRPMAVKLLMPLVSSVVDVPCRMEAYALVWEQVVEVEMQPNGEGTGVGKAQVRQAMNAASTILTIQAMLEMLMWEVKCLDCLPCCPLTLPRPSQTPPLLLASCPCRRCFRTPTWRASSRAQSEAAPLSRAWRRGSSDRCAFSAGQGGRAGSQGGKWRLE